MWTSLNIFTLFLTVPNVWAAISAPEQGHIATIEPLDYENDNQTVEYTDVESTTLDQPNVESTTLHQLDAESTLHQSYFENTTLDQSHVKSTTLHQSSDNSIWNMVEENNTTDYITTIATSVGAPGDSFTDGTFHNITTDETPQEDTTNGTFENFPTDETTHETTNAKSPINITTAETPDNHTNNEISHTSMPTTVVDTKPTTVGNITTIEPLDYENDNQTVEHADVESTTLDQSNVENTTSHQLDVESTTLHQSYFENTTLDQSDVESTTLNQSDVESTTLHQSSPNHTNSEISHTSMRTTVVDTKPTTVGNINSTDAGESKNDTSESSTVARTTQAPSNTTRTTSATAITSTTQRTNTTTEAIDSVKRQRELYHWGPEAGDSMVSRNQDDYYYWYDTKSQPIYFTGGAPMGSEKFTVANVLANGVITFGTRSWAWWPDFNYASSDQQTILAPFWFQTNYAQPGKVYYHLYEKQDVKSSSRFHTEVLARATNEVKEFYGVDDFKAMAVLVATWERVQPYTWYTWLCDYYDYYKNVWWWQEYYFHLYEDYCLHSQTETNTFQAVYVTDGQEAYVIVTYKYGEMRWRHEKWRYIAVGFVTTDDIRDYGVTNTEVTTKMDRIVWNTGRYGTWIEKVGQIVNPDGRCMEFYIENLYLKDSSTHQKWVKDLFDCPCSLERMGMQWWQYSNDEVPGSNRTYRICYAIGMTAKTRLVRLQNNPLNKLCCYLITYPSSHYWYWEDWLQARRNALYIQYQDPKAGHLLLNDPWYWWGNNARKSRAEDMNPHKWCCEDASSPKLCALFNEVRPDYGCSPDAEFVTGVALGDPHIKTLDSREYTINGLGEYTLLEISEQKFILQGRTQQVLNNQGNKTSATVFVAFAVREGNDSSFQVELDKQQTGMIITACGVDVTRDFYKSDNYNETHGNNNVSVIRIVRGTRTSVVASFPCGVSLEVYVGLKNLEFSTNIPKDFKGKTLGLLGNFNGDASDDFVLPDGRILTEDETNTERKIFYNFGREWEVTTDNSVFAYPEGESALDYQFSEFEPIFREEVDEATLNEAKKLCGEEGSDACTFDYIATKDAKFADLTKNTSREADSVKISQENNLPVLSLDTKQLNSKQQWEVTHGKQTTVDFHATDADKNDTVTYQLKVNPKDVSVNSFGVLTYFPDSNSPVTIGVQARDSKGGLSNVIYLDIVVCPTCSLHGVCNKNRTRERVQEGGRFLLFVCDCHPAYTGEDCEQELDACATSPCSPGQNCTDLTATEQGENRTGYVCGSCPSGFTEHFGVCADINECISNGSAPVCPSNAACTNNVGSYTCTCDLGFRQDILNKSLCKDIDECAERTHKCDHICHNLEGSYNCSCFDGNILNSDGKTCRQIANPAECSKCQHACVVKDGTVSCSCKSGYQLVNGTNCADINECKFSNTPCSQACQNTEGGFTCSCYPGYKLAEDGVSCTACEQPYYGENCASLCVCNGHGTCNHVHGCQCGAGWTGTNCDSDVDECQTSSTACTVGQICTNTIGNFSCSCQSGFTMISGVCHDINECLDVLDNTCSLSVEDCVNNRGSYSCSCREGYARNANGVCEDIDECTNKNHDCEQICENTPGKYNCKCYYGYQLDSDRTHCVKRETDVCANVPDIDCEQICTVDLSTNTPYCRCNSGFSLSGKKKCVDINECGFPHLNLCEYKEGCLNTNGNYKCSCLPGSMLDNNGRSCVVCSSGKWGAECSEDCACSTGASYCDAKRGCICKSGYTGTHCDIDIDECKTGLVTCQAGEQCINKPGNASCECLPGYTRMGNSCQDINECASAITNNCDQICENYIGGYICGCNKGYHFNIQSKTCEDINECNLKLDDCEQVCENSNGGYRCSCHDGLTLDIDGVSCIVKNQCTSMNCAEKCAVVDGKETCYCSKGQEVDTSDETKCKDKDMCFGHHCSGGCQEISNGTSFMCTCPTGQKLAADGYSCVDCTEGTYGEECLQKCVCNAATTQSCDKVSGVCNCKEGWTSSNCSKDKNECSEPAKLCPTFSECVNVPGGFVCKCNDGYFSTSSGCQACLPNTYGTECMKQCTCDTSHSTCDSVSGKCICHTGWEGDNCDKDKNECSQVNNCTAANKEHWVCINTEGSYKCDCKSGYQQDKNSSCVDLDECAAAFSNECDQNCTNTVGSYTCLCSKGYHLASDGYKCEDIDECSQSPAVCQQVCSNNIGGYDCSCQEGYQIREDNPSSCYAAVGAKTELTIPMDVENKNLREQKGKDYLELKAVIEPALKEEFSKTVKSVTAVTVTRLRRGSLIIDVTTIIDKTNNPRAATEMVEAILLLLEYGVTINQTHYNVTVKTGGFAVNASTDKCLILHAVEPCKEDETCARTTQGEVYCKKQADDDSVDIPLVVGLAVGIPLGVALILAIAAACWYKKKYKAMRKIHIHEEMYSEHDHISSGEMGSGVSNLLPRPKLGPPKEMMEPQQNYYLHGPQSAKFKWSTEHIPGAREDGPNTMKSNF